jgi:lipopolysaccharide export system permease protein
VAQLFLNLLPYLLSYAIPMAVLTSTLLAFGRLSADNEITAMRAAGITLYRIGVPIAVLGLLFSMLCLLINDRWMPHARFASRKLLKEIGVKRPTAYLEPGTFIKDFEGYVLFIYGIEEEHLRNVRIYQPQEGRPTRTIIAERGAFTFEPVAQTLRMTLYDGTSDEPDPRDPTTFYKLNFHEYIVSMHYKRDPSDTLEKKPKDMTVDELRHEIRRLTDQSVDPTPLQTELHKKFSLSFSSLSFVLLAFPLAVVTRRGERAIGFGVSLLVIIVYYILMAVGDALALRQLCPPALGMWMPNVLLLITALLLLRKVAAR